MAVDKHVVVVGGGLAGMACAVALADNGVRVTLVEARHMLGGRASSFENEDAGKAGAGGAVARRRGGMTELLDNCQHVLLGCCTNLLDFYKRMGVSGKIGFYRQIHFLNERGVVYDLSGIGKKGGVPAPLHLGMSMAFFSLLTMGERISVTRAMLAMMRMGKSGRNRLETVPFGEWLDEHWQHDEVIRKFYDPVLVGALNEQTRRASAKYAIKVFQDALLANSKGYRLGLPTVPLSDLYARLPKGPARPESGMGGVEVRLNARVEEILFEGGDKKVEIGDFKVEVKRMEAAGVKLRNGDVILGDAVVLATNYHAVTRWVAPLPSVIKDKDGRFKGLTELESVPILGVHLWFDRPMMEEASAVLVKGPLQWLFRKDKVGKQLHGVISAARGWEDVPREEALQQFEAQVRSLFPEAKEAKLLRGVIVIEKRATFSPLPGTDRLRPVQWPGEEGVQGLYLAGDYTMTDWPATMEGAVRSGYMAAEAILRGYGKDVKVVVDDLEVQWPGRMMGLAR